VFGSKADEENGANLMKSEMEIKSDTAFAICLITVSILLSRGMMYLWFAFFHGSWEFSLFIQKINIWDAGWYRSIALELYTDHANDPVTGQAGWAFFPLFPVIVHCVYQITGIDVNYIGSFFSTVLLGMAELAGYKYIIMTRNSVKQGIGYIYFMSFGAYSFYFSALYSEALYLFLLTCAFYFMQKEHYLKMGMAGALLSLTRNTGIFFCFAILVHRIKKYRESTDRSFAGFVKETVCNDRLILGTMIVPLGFFSYMVYLKYKVGDAFAFMHVQRAWWRENIGVIRVLGGELFDRFPPGYLGVCFLLGVYLLVMLIWKHRRAEEAVLPLITLALAAASSLGSTPRYMAGSFAVVLALTDEWIGCTKWNQFFICAGMFLFETMCVNAWLDGSLLLI